MAKRWIAVLGCVATSVACATTGFPLKRQSYSSVMPSDRIAVGDLHACHIVDGGAVICWGAGDVGDAKGEWPNFGQATPPAQSFSRISAGSFHSCGVTTEGTIVCWGAGQKGAHGAVHHNQSDSPPGKYVDVSCGEYHSCGVRTNGTVVCWGDNTYGQSTVPLGKYTRVAAGAAHTCAIGPEGLVSCWGLENDGQTRAPAATFVQISAGSAHTCGLREDGEAVCWGYDEHGVTAPPQRRFVDICAGGLNACGLDGSGTVHCWGANEPGQATRSVEKFETLAVGRNNACGVTPTGVPICWGRNDYGQSEAPVLELDSTSTEQSSGDVTAIRIASGEVTDGLLGEYTTVALRNTKDAHAARVFNRVGEGELFSFMVEGPGVATVRLHRLVDADGPDEHEFNLLVLENDVLLQHLQGEIDTSDRYTVVTTSPIKPAVTQPKEYRLTVGAKMSRFDILVRNAPGGMAFAYEFEPEELSSSESMDAGQSNSMAASALSTVVAEVVLETYILRDSVLGLGARGGVFFPVVGGDPGPTVGLEVLAHLPWLDRAFSFGLQGTFIRHHIGVSAGATGAILNAESTVVVVPLVAKLTGRFHFAERFAAYGFAGFGNSFVRAERNILGVQSTTDKWLWTAVVGGGAEMLLGPGALILEGSYMYADPANFGTSLQGYAPTGPVWLAGYRLGI